MGLVSIIALVLSTVGIYLIYTTFKETRKGAESTQKAAQSARDTYMAFVELERARIVAEPSQILWNPPHISAVRVSLTNIGRSSAAVLTAHCEYLDGCDYPGDFLQTMRIDRAVASGEDTSFTVHVYEGVTFEMPPYIGGYVEYRTTFARTHRSYFFAQIEYIPADDEGYALKLAGYGLRANPDHCTRDARESRFGWPADG